jgi:hypothetical protein
MALLRHGQDGRGGTAPGGVVSAGQHPEHRGGDATLRSGQVAAAADVHVETLKAAQRLGFTLAP